MSIQPLLSVASHALRPFAKHVYRLHAERQAAAPWDPHQPSFIDKLLDETLNRLRAGNPDDSWWRQLLDRVGHNYVSPDFLQKPALREWLATDQVATDFKVLSKASLLAGSSTESHARQRLAQAYSKHTGEASHLSNGPIDTVVAVLIASYIASIPRDQHASVGIIQTGFTRTEAQLDRIAHLLQRPPLDSASHDLLCDYAHKQLTEILRLRAIDPLTARREVRSLLERAQSSGLPPTNPLMNRLIYWTARLLAADPSALPYARELRTHLEHTSTQNQLAIIDALIAHSDGDTDLALSLLRDADDPDSRSSLLALIADIRSAQSAVDWSNEHNEHSDPEFFTAFGWTNWAICSAERERWEPAAKQLLAVEHLWGESPRLPFVEGAINAALLLPEDYRNSVLQGLPLYPGIETAQGSSAQAHHARATACFQDVAQTTHHAPDTDFAKLLAHWTLWLRLADPNVNNAASARSEIQQRMSTGSDASELIVFAVTFDIPFDPHPLQRHLYNRKQFGGLDDNDLIAEFMLARTSMSPRRLYSYVEQHHTLLSNVLSTAFLLHAQVDALIRDGQTQRARALVEANATVIGAAQASRFRVAIDAEEGIDPRSHLESLYDRTNSLIDLQNLVSCLAAVEDNIALRPLTIELFRREHTVQNALRVVRCLMDPSLVDHPSVIEFLECQTDLVRQSDDLRSANAWALVLAGRPKEAKHINDGLLNRRAHPNDFFLETRIAIASGNWERLGAAIDREWPRRHAHDAATLLHMAALASQESNDPSRALALARLATEKAPNDPRTLVAAYSLHCKLASEDRADPSWLAQASDLSSEEQGPVWRLDPSYVINHLLPKRRELVLDVERASLRGEIPIGTATAALNGSLARIFLQLPDQNAHLLDGRTRSIIPTVSGTRSPVDAQPEWTIALDVTTIMALHALEILDTTIESFHHVKLSLDIMELLFYERDEIRFHQPSRIAAAKQIQGLLQSKGLRIATPVTPSPPRLVEEVGLELASLLNLAEQNLGVVVCGLPLHRPGSLLEQRADTRAYDHLIWSTVDICNFLYDNGKLDAHEHRRAISVLNSRNQTTRSERPDISGNGPIYIDDLALTYLRDAKVLEPLASAGLEIRIHAGVSARASALLAEGEVAYDLGTTIERIRTILRTAIEDRKASFLPTPVPPQPRDHLDTPTLASTVSLLASTACCDALCIDDRYFNSNGSITDPSGTTTPVICLPDLLRHLQSTGAIDAARHWILRHQLRRSGFAFIPLEEEELRHWLSQARVAGGQLTETAELRVIRQTVSRIDSAEFLSPEEAVIVSARLHRISNDTIDKLWSDLSLSEESVVALSLWIWRFLMITTDPERKQSSRHSRGQWLQRTTALRIAQLLLPTAIYSEDREDRRAQWIETGVLDRLRPASSDTILSALRFASEAISANQHGHEHYGNLFLQQLPPLAHTLFVSTYPELSRRYGFSLESTFRFGPDVTIRSVDLEETARRVLATNTSATVRTVSEPENAVVLCPSEGKITLQWRDDQGATRGVQMPELGILSPQRATRRTALEYIADRIGPTGPGFLYPSGQRAAREMSDDDVAGIFSRLTNGVAATQVRLASKLDQRLPMDIGDLVPAGTSYYEQFCGPNARGHKPESYFRDVLIPYRQELLVRHLAKGLDICLLGALRDDLSPGQWLSGVADDAAWSAMQSCSVWNNPFALIGAIDVALYRQHDSRFEDFATRGVTALCSDAFGSCPDLNIYNLLPHLFHVVLFRLSMIPNGAGYPGYWRRMCAWMQAGVLANALSRSHATIDVEWIDAWTQSGYVLEGIFASLIDLRTEPLFLPTRGTTELLKGEVGGRLSLLRQRHEREGRDSAAWEVFDSFLARTRVSRGGRFPGPLEAHTPATESAPQHVLDDIEVAWAEDRDTSAVGKIAVSSHIYRMPQATLIRVRNAVKGLGVTFGKGEFVRLASASIVAAANRDVQMADDIAQAVANMASHVSESSDIGRILEIVLRTAAAHTGPDDWYTFLENILARLAYALPAPPSDCLEVFRHQLRLMGNVLPMDSWFQLRAILIASSGLV